MKRLSRTLLLIALGLTVFSFSLFITVKMLFPPAKVRVWTEGELAQQLGRQVQVGGIALNPLSIEITRLKISEKGGFGLGTFLIVERGSVRWKLLPLLRRRIVIPQIVLKHPILNIILQPNKASTVDDLALRFNTRLMSYKTSSPQPANTGARKKQRRPWVWDIQRMTLEEASFIIDDQTGAGRSTSLSNINLTLQDFGPLRMSGSLHIDELRHPYYQAKDLNATWSLQNMEDKGTRLTGKISLTHGPGTIRNAAGAGNASDSTRLLLRPLVLLQNVLKSSNVKTSLPHLQEIVIQQLISESEFNNGIMTVKGFKLTGPQMNYEMTGTVQLATTALLLRAAVHFPATSATSDVEATLVIDGTLNNPKIVVEKAVAKGFKATLKSFLP